MTTIDRVFIAALVYVAAILPCANEEKFGIGRTIVSTAFILLAIMWIVSASF